MPKTLCTTRRMVLGLLRENSRATVSEMAARLGISRTTVAYHLDQLVERGYIRRFTIETDPALDPAPPGLRAMFDISLNKTQCDVVYSMLADWPEVLFVWSLSGSVDMRILVEAPDQGRIDALRARLARDANILTVTTSFVLQTWAERPPLRTATPSADAITHGTETMIETTD